MQFMIKALDGEGKLAKRMEVRPRHLEGMEKLRSNILCRKTTEKKCRLSTI